MVQHCAQYKPPHQRTLRAVYKKSGFPLLISVTNSQTRYDLHAGAARTMKNVRQELSDKGAQVPPCRNPAPLPIAPPSPAPQIQRKHQRKMTMNYPRTHYEAVLDVRYGWRFNELNERFYQRLDGLLGFICYFGGSATLIGVLAHHPVFTTIASLCVASAGVLNHLISASRKAYAHAIARAKYAALDARAPRLKLEELDAELKRLQGNSPNGIRALSMPAFNTNLLSNGRPDKIQSLTFWHKWVNLMA